MKNKIVVNLPNALTLLRIVGSVVLLFLKAFSLPFLQIYVLCGISDILDGFLARKLNVSSKMGSDLDSLADFIFIVVCFIKIFPDFSLSIWVWGWIGGIAFIKALSLIISYVQEKSCGLRHTILNKAVGLVLFVSVLFVRMSWFVWAAVCLCVLATVAAIQELVINLGKREI